MRDVYPRFRNLPADYLVAPELQPEYLDLPGLTLDDTANLADHILGRAGSRAGALAIIHHEGSEQRQFTFADLDRSSSRLAAALANLGVVAGDRVAYRSSNRPEAVITALACWRLGAIVVPTPPQAHADELRFHLLDAAATTLVAYGRESYFSPVPAALDGTEVINRIAFGERPNADGWHWWPNLIENASGPDVSSPVHADTPALVWHTGGTTGIPKGCYHTQRRFLAAGYSFGAATWVQPGQRWAAAAPIGHALGFIYHTIFTLLHGATVVMIEDFSKPDVVLRAISEHRVDTFTAIAATWARMLEAIDAEPELDAVGGLRRAYAMWQSASSTDVYDRWKQRGVELLNNFGSTAFANWVLVPRPGENSPRGSLGRPAPGYRVIAIERESRLPEPLPAGTPGRMAVQGPSGLTYWRRPDQQERDVTEGWTLVDDLISFDDAGNAAYLGRNDFMISSAGFKVAPVEVEQVLNRHPAVREVAVIGTPDPIRQEVVTAFVALHPGTTGSEGLRRELQDFVKAELAPFKYPRRIVFVDGLPRDPVGKVQPRLLQQLAAAGQSKESK